MKTLISCVLGLISLMLWPTVGLASQVANCMQHEQARGPNQQFRQFYNQIQCSSFELSSQVANCMQIKRHNQEQLQRQQEDEQQENQQQEQQEPWRRHRYRD